MKYKYTELPQFIPMEIYEDEITKMVKTLISSDKVISVFQVGGISNPGISDIDFYVIFKNDVNYLQNPVQQLSYPGNNLFTHRLFGTSLNYATQLEQFTFFNKYNLLAGEKINMTDYELSAADRKLLEHQIALEYLIKAWVIVSLSKTFKIVKLRNLMLYAKAILYDIEFLGISDLKFLEVVNEILDIRKKWFSEKISLHRLDSIIDEYHDGLYRCITDAISKFNFYISPASNTLISKRVKIEKSEKIQINRNGFLIPASLANSSSKIMKLQNKINHFTVNLPVTESGIPDIISRRQQTINEAIVYNNKNLPGFLCTAYGMNIFEVIQK
ncbi:MAG TPA: hypothetical protein PKD91_02445 [Bacteroidia bacterium]|nr:hypothetical protein [Bacteroidia bacterium]